MGGFSGGLWQIWDAVQGKNVEDGTGSGGGGGSNTAFKVLLATVAFVYGSNFGAIKYLDEVRTMTVELLCVGGDIRRINPPPPCLRTRLTPIQ